MFNITKIIFSEYFSRIFHVEDTTKIGGKGFLQRFVESLAELWDDTVIDVLKNFIDNTLVPTTVLSKFIPYLELHMGMPTIHENLTIRRNILKVASEIWLFKGTLKSYQLIFNALGFNGVDIIPVPFIGGFDNSTRFDSTTRKFDRGKCPKCQYYTLNLLSDADIDNEMYEAIRNALYLIDPIYVRLFSITINNIPVNLLDIFIESNGDLVYSALSNTNVGLVLLSNGDLIIVGDDSDQYSIDSNGNLIYNER